MPTLYETFTVFKITHLLSLTCTTSIIYPTPLQLNSLWSNLILSSQIHASFKVLFLSDFIIKFLYTLPPYMLHVPPISSSIISYHSNTWQGVQVINLSIMQFSLVSSHFIPLRPKYFPQYPVLEHPQPTFSPPVQETKLYVFRLWTATQNILNQMLEHISRLQSIHNFCMHAILICWEFSQIFKLCQTFKRWSLVLHIAILYCNLFKLLEYILMFISNYFYTNLLTSD
jgi:hypothetical protein